MSSPQLLYVSYPKKQKYYWYQLVVKLLSYDFHKNCNQLIWNLFCYVTKKLANIAIKLNLGNRPIKDFKPFKSFQKYFWLLGKFFGWKQK